jgi:PAS domain S-box-containing protein
MAESRKSLLLFALAFSLIVALAALVADDNVRDRLGYAYYVIALAIIGSVLLILAGYAWDRSLVQRLKSLRTSVPVAGEEPPDEPEHDEVIALARQIERMAQTLQKTEASYRGIVEDQADLICRYRLDGRLTFVNRAYAEAVGRKRTELIGQPFPHFASGSAIGHAPFSFEREMDFPDGRRRWLLWTQRTLQDDAGRALEFQAVGHDISLRKEAEAALLQARDAAEAADRTKSDFLASVSQEIRIPIGGVIQCALSLAKSPLSAEQREQVATIKASAQALEKLIADIHDLTQLESGRILAKPASFNLHRCVDETVAAHLPRARTAALDLVARIEPDVPAAVCSDEARLRQILGNLIDNALKFTAQGRVAVHVTCTRGDPSASGDSRQAVRVFFAVSDTGVGLPADKLARLVGSPVPAEGPSDRRRGGPGLGLAVSRRLCELLGGSLSIDSKPGHGTTVRFSVLADCDSRPPLGLAAATAAGTAT